MRVLFLLLVLLWFVALLPEVQAGDYNAKRGTDSYFLSKSYDKSQLVEYAKNWSAKFGLDESLVMGQIEQESHWKNSSVSKKGAKGLMQLMPATAKYMGMSDSESLYNPYTNIYYGCLYMRYLMSMYNDTDLALVAYYGGPGRANKIRSGSLNSGNFFDELIGYATSVKNKSIKYKNKTIQSIAMY